MSEYRWARVEGDDTYGLRRGAWYRILDLTPDTAVVEVQRKPVALPRATVRIIDRPARVWTVVRPGPGTRGLPATWGTAYGVCPSCRTRAPLKGSPQTLRCPRCQDQFRVGWKEWFVGDAGQ